MKTVLRLRSATDGFEPGRWAKSNRHVEENRDEYDNRLCNIKAKGKILKRQKTFKIDNSEIPFFINGRPELLIQILYTYFLRKDLLDEYFSQYK